MTTTLLAGFDIAAPVSAPTTIEGVTSGSLGAGLYSYTVTYVTAYGETLASSASTPITTASGSINILTIPVSPDANVTSRNIYRTASGGTPHLFLRSVSGNLALAATIVDIAADGSLGLASPTINTAASHEVLRGYVTKTQPSINSVTVGITANAAGTQAAGTLITSEYNVLATVGGAGYSVTLPLLNAILVGMHISIINTTGTAANVYPAAGQQINALGANTAFSLGAGLTLNMTAVSATLWLQF